MIFLKIKLNICNLKKNDNDNGKYTTIRKKKKENQHII